MREKLIELVSDAELPMKNDGRIIGWFALGFHEALHMADHLIANDVVPVVRCKDCKHYGSPEDIDILGHCLNKRLCVSCNGEVYPEKNYFCAYGERK